VPSFLVLLYALQRLKLEQRGFNTSLDDRVSRAHFGTFDRNYAREIVEPKPMFVTIDGKEFGLTGEVYYSTLSIIGRGTLTVAATFGGGPPDQSYAVKISWPEESRPNEVQAAMESA